MTLQVLLPFHSFPLWIWWVPLLHLHCLGLHWVHQLSFSPSARNRDGQPSLPTSNFLLTLYVYRCRLKKNVADSARTPTQNSWFKEKLAILWLNLKTRKALSAAPVEEHVNPQHGEKTVEVWRGHFKSTIFVFVIFKLPLLSKNYQYLLEHIPQMKLCEDSVCLWENSKKTKALYP